MSRLFCRTLFGLRSGSWRIGALSLLAVACGEPAAPPAPPLPEVGVVVLSPQPAANVVEVPGRVQAVRTAQVRARVDGVVQKIEYPEGSDVAEGQLLFSIDPRSLRAEAGAVRAALSRAQATVANAAQDVARYEGLVAEQAISEQEYDAAIARLRTAEADVQQMRAQLEGAELALSYTRVTAPIAGRAGRAQVTEGALVSATSATLLTTVEQFDPVYVNFSRSSGDLLRVRREITEKRLLVPELRSVVVRLVLEDGSEYSEPGRLDFFDLSIDQATGTAALRAEFPNPNRTLLPGQFVRAFIEAGVRPEALQIPQRAAQITAQGAQVMVVDERNVASARPVTLGPMNDGSWSVLEGLKPGERVIVDGLQKVRPGQTVNVTGAPARAPPATREDPATAAGP